MSPPEMPAWNLGLRFGLEPAALAGLAATAWQLTDGARRWVLTVGVPLAAAVAWGTFNAAGRGPCPPPGLPATGSSWCGVALPTRVG